MASPSLESKTVRPGSLGSYSYYRSNRQPEQGQKASPYIASSRRKLVPKRFIITAFIIAGLIGLPLLRGDGAPAKQSASSQPKTQQTNQAPAAATAAAPVKKTDACADNSLDKLILVSVSQRHLWACEGGKTVHDTPVITGMTAYEPTLTPPGTYHVYGKQTDTRLTGSDVTGEWNRAVDYWMPFLDNQHGTYGFHDATWRPDSDFGNVSPDSNDASHGCVELPLGSMSWLYHWAPVRTTVTIKA
jgi:lipoprotein-anchoring transpeptidase ErfK/SrfK